MANYVFGGDDSINLFLNLPKDIVMYLFSKLEVCSIIRCRSVCKHRLRLLSQPEFVKLHLNHSKTTNKLLIPSDFGSPYIFESNDHGPHCSNTPRVRSINLPLGGEGVSYSAKILGSCNGLLCIFMRNKLKVEKDHPHRLHYKKNKYKLLVWNPSTRDYKVIPDPNPSLNSYYEYFGIFIGFGYDSSCEDYKLVKACFRPPCKLETYSLKTSLWTVIKSDPLYTSFETYRCIDEGISVNGSFLYWVVIIGKGERRIVHYELEKEKFTELQCLPTDINGFDVMPKLLKVMGGNNLGLSCYYNNKGRRDPCIRLWMMNKEGDKEEWSRLWSMSYGTDIGRQLTLESMFNGPICDFEKGSVLFYHSEVQSATNQRLVLIVVDPKLNKIIGTTSVSGITNPYRLRIATYIETLVSPNALVA